MPSWGFSIFQPASVASRLVICVLEKTASVFATASLLAAVRRVASDLALPRVLPAAPSSSWWPSAGECRGEIIARKKLSCPCKFLQWADTRS